MKKSQLLPLLFFLGIANVFSQSKKNDLKFTVSTLPLFSYNDDLNLVMNGLVINPSIGYYISGKTSIDINFTYATLNNLKIRGIDSYYNSYAFIPTLRNNLLNKEKLRIFAEIGFGLGTIKYEANDKYFHTTKHDELSGGISIIDIGLGANYFFNEKFGIELIIPYISTKNITSNRSNNLYSGFGPSIGFTFMMD